MSLSGDIPVVLAIAEGYFSCDKSCLRHPFNDPLFWFYSLPVQEDINYTPNAALLTVAKSKPVTPELISNRISACAMKDTREYTDWDKFKVRFNSTPFVNCLYSNTCTALENADLRLTSQNRNGFPLL
jgi:hypothetical protein